MQPDAIVFTPEDPAIEPIRVPASKVKYGLCTIDVKANGVLRANVLILDIIGKPSGHLHRFTTSNELLTTERGRVYVNKCIDQMLSEATGA